VSFKLDQSEIDWLDKLAAERGQNRSETIRAMLIFAARMPRDWRPPSTPGREVVR
jgi:metal-responsive CopG/Arc/MetJ family transcriptional regulator